ncbi:helix-turn-helix-type transcriptional regulator [Solitalea longa]|uniref:Helix-turn-helix-type transcriptional regulator n=1 Tax=Solitalea longa TaxID=2079460 RepID=A0A2S5A0I1_9SPHI|nr:MerR family transcriptional regulator [Solitalea longa]POY35752.1 helix-turn-helix-type transcriptional regulator [Solitalea longa]
MKKFSISDIECLTGIKAHTIRIWEQRYNLITPKRTCTNIRYFDDNDLKKFLNISLLLDSGMRISEIAKMSDQEINKYIEKLSECEINGCSCTIGSLCNAMLTLDEAVFEETMQTSLDSMGMERTMLEVIHPFMRKIGIMWQAGTINPAHEHFITHLIRQKLITAINSLQPSNPSHAKKYMLFLPEGEVHELGLLFANYMIKARGHHVLYLGANLPFEDLLSVANYYDPDYALTFLISDNAFGDVNLIISKILENLPNWTLAVSGNLAVTGSIKPHSRLTIIKDVPQMIDFINTNAEVQRLYFTC